MAHKKYTIEPMFYKSNLEKPVAKTAGELISILQRLPADLPIESGFSEAVQVIVYNYGKDDCHLEIEEFEEFDHDDDDDEEILTIKP